jgi:crotonobetainyl-CoA:carnitine CoA-transferase CaiB-like acyl-CoA transferase
VLIRAGVPVAVVNTPATILDDPEIRSLDLIHEEGGLHMHLPVLGMPRLELAPAPGFGEHTDRIRAHGWDALGD